MTAPDLLPCPFCGGKAELNDCLVECGFCLCAVPDGFGYEGERLGYATEAEAIAAWNRRAAIPPAKQEHVAVSNARGVGVTTVDDLANIIRMVDGQNSLGAGALAEAILAAIAPTDAAQVREAAHDLVGFLDGKHVSYMAAKGRDPKKYTSGWSIARDKAAAILALIDKP